jgi:hypothetical protein
MNKKNRSGKEFRTRGTPQPIGNYKLIINIKL